MRRARGQQDGEALESLIQRGYRYALSLTRDAAAAEDLLQDAWISILSRRAPRHVGYLFATIRNRFVDLDRRRRLVVLEPLEPEVAPWIEEDPLDLEAHHVRADEVEKVLGALRAEEREVLYLAVVEGWSVREIAELTDRPLGTVSSWLRRAKLRLRRRVEPCTEVAP